MKHRPAFLQTQYKTIAIYHCKHHFYACFVTTFKNCLTSAGSFANTNWIIITLFDENFQDDHHAYNQDVLILGRNELNNSSKMKYFRQTRYDVTHSNSSQAKITKTRNCPRKLPLECKRLGETKTSCNLHKVPDANFASKKLGKETHVYCHNYTYLNQTEIAAT